MFEAAAATSQGMRGIGCSFGEAWHVDLAVALPATGGNFAPAASGPAASLDAYLDALGARGRSTPPKSAAALSRLWTVPAGRRLLATSLSGDEHAFAHRRGRRPRGRGLPSLAAAQNALALKRVLLSTGGVGYFEYEATVSGNAGPCPCRSASTRSDDVLKSVIVGFDDQGGVRRHLAARPRAARATSFANCPSAPADLGSPVALLNALRGD